MERVMGIEPTLVAWEATVLPLNYTRAPLHTMEAGENSRAPAAITTRRHAPHEAFDSHGIATGVPRSARTRRGGGLVHRGRQGERGRESRAPPGRAARRGQVAGP